MQLIEQAENIPFKSQGLLKKIAEDYETMVEGLKTAIKEKNLEHESVKHLRQIFLLCYGKDIFIESDVDSIDFEEENKVFRKMLEERFEEEEIKVFLNKMEEKSEELKEFINTFEE